MTTSAICAKERIQSRPIFTGKERDTESGNDYFDARYYSSSMGRFMSPDWAAQEEPVPYANLDDPQSLNLYAYVENNPLARVDADGHEGDGCCDFSLPIDGPLMPPLPDPFHPIVPYSDEYTLTPEKLQQGLNDAGDAISSFVQSSSETIRKRWEKFWGKTWPLDPDTGQKQHVSHEPIPKADGGTDDVKTNIQPRPAKDHRKWHAERGDHARWAKRAKQGKLKKTPEPPKPDPPKPDPPKTEGN